MPLAEFTPPEPVLSGRIATLRARERDGGQPVLLRLAAEGDEEREVRRRSLVKEYHILRDLDDIAVFKPLRLLEEGERTVLVLQDPGATPIERLRLHRIRPMATLCDLSLQILGIVERLHGRSVLHLNLNPSSVWYGEDTDTIYLGSFQFASRMDHLETDPSPFFAPDRMPAYLSPEQSGLVRRPVDVRSDFYGVGATLYFLFTGRAPFHDRDLTGIQHSVIASPPDAPEGIDPHLPHILTLILMKALSKDPAERYQSIAGFRRDLERARDLILSGHTETTFLLGDDDLSGEFRFPSHLFGRDAEISILRTMYGQACEGQKNVLLLQGPPGSGKTTLVLEMQRDVAVAGGFFAMGRPEEGMQAPTASFLTDALEHIFTRILRMPETELARYRHELLHFLPPWRNVLIDLCPSLEWIVGRGHAETTQVTSGESHRQLIESLIALFRVLSPRGSPLFLFFDDLHRADPAGLDILSALIEEPELEGIMFVLAYRRDEARGSAAEFPAVLSRRYGYTRQIELHNLNREALQQILVTMFPDAEKVEDLASVFFRKTGGNPFYLRETLQTSFDRHWIRFTDNRWTFNRSAIEGTGFSENVAALLTERIHELPEAERQLLEFASIIGETFDVFTLYWVSGWTPERIVSLLRELYRLDFILPGDEAAAALEATGEEADRALFHGQSTTFRFTHERIRRAAYDSADEQSRNRLHAYAGIHLLEFASREPAYLDRNLFRVVGHLNEGRQFLDEKVKRRLVSLNLEAGFRALKAGDPETTLGFFRTGMSLKDQPDLNEEEDFQLHVRTAEAELLAGSPAAGDALFQKLYKHVFRPEWRMRIYRVHLPLYMLYNRLEEGLEMILDALREEGLTISLHATAQERATAWARLRATGLLADPGRLLQTAEVKDESTNRLIELLSLACLPAFANNHALFEVLTLEAAILLVKGSSAFAPEILSRLFSILPPDYEVALACARTARELIDTRYNEKNIAQNLYWYSLFVAPYGEDPLATVHHLEQAVTSGHETDNLCFAGRAAVLLTAHSLLTGQGLDRVGEIPQEQLPLLKRMRQEDPLLQLGLWKTAVHALRGESANPTRISGPDFRSEEVIPLWEAAGNQTAAFSAHLILSLLQYLQDNLQAAHSEMEKALPLMAGVKGTVLENTARFLECLILFRYSDSPDREQRLRQNAQEFRVRAFHFPRHFMLWHRITEALLELLEDRRADAVYHFEEALALSGQSGRLIERALTEDLLYEIYRSEQKKSQEILYFTEALSSHRAWGCGARLHRLVESSRENANMLLTRMEGWRAILSDPALDAEAAPDARLLLEASGAISRETSLEGVVRTILGVLIRLSGAERAFFFYRKQGRLRLVAEGGPEAGVRYDAEGGEVFDRKNPIPHSMLLFSLRTGKPVLEHNAFEEGDYSSDPYISRYRVRSALCMPLLRSGQVHGLLYLENRMTGHTFHPARIELLRQLSGQMVVSLANADHYESLEEQIRERTRNLKETLGQVELLKQQQDVDYYLISVLLRPLLQNETNPDHYRISFLIRQKKRFRFKKWMVEIGGDLCFGADLILRGQKLLFLVNGDAMGKSLQGSGGALVLGSVLKALVERTRLTPALQNVTPEEWLLHTAHEIHQVFTTFNGLMFVTAIVALLDEATHTLHFLNAGHPRPVLLHLQSSSMIGERPIALKPGMRFFQAAIENVETLQLDPGDIVVFASDGRDDILLHSEGSERFMNDDEGFFLRAVERAGGNQRSIYRELCRAGEISDDLSLIRIERPL